MILLCAAVKIRVLVQSAETDDSKQSVCELRYSNKHSFSRFQLFVENHRLLPIPLAYGALVGDNLFEFHQDVPRTIIIISKLFCSVLFV